MRKEDFFEVLGELDGDIVKRARESVECGSLHKGQGGISLFRKIFALAAIVALMLCSGAVGALAFRQETIVEVPAHRETVELEEIGLTLVLPESWKGRYEVVETTFAPTGTAMWEFCVKSIYDSHTPLDEDGDIFIKGLLFSVLQCEQYSMSAEDFMKESPLAGMGRYLFATEDATYAIWYATDVQFKEDDPEQAEEYRSLAQDMSGIQIVMSGMMD